jgi:hypothetical protein
MLPADQVEALESLVCEIKRVPSVGERAVRVGGKQEVGEREAAERTVLTAIASP